MKDKSTLLAWGIAVLAMLLAIVGWAGNARYQAQVAELEAQNEALTQQVARMENFSHALEAQDHLIDELTEELDRLSARLENAMADTPAGPDREGAALSPNMMQDLFSGMLDGMDESLLDMDALLDEDIDFDDLSPEAIQDWIRSISESEGMQNAQTNMMVNLQYAPLLDELQLPPEKEAAVRDILAMYAREELRRSMDMIGSGNIPSGQDMHAQELDARERLLNDLAGVLDADEMAAFEAYEQDKEFYVLQQTFDMQLGMFGAGMMPETRERAREILAEETLLAMDDLRQSAQPMGARESMNHNMAAMENARARLEAELSPEEFGKVDSFITDMIEMATASMSMFENFGMGGANAE